MNIKFHRLLSLAVLAYSMLSSNAYAQKVEAPEHIAKWRGWIEQGRTERNCPEQNAESCLWVSKLDLVSDSGKKVVSISFAVDNLLNAPSKVMLPGNEMSWPESVVFNGKGLPIGKQDGIPYIMIGAGEKGRIDAKIDMSRSTSTTLSIPPSFVLANAKRSTGETIWFDPSQGYDIYANEKREVKIEAPSSEKGGATSIKISRMITDGQIPLLTTRIKIDNGGGRKTIRIDQVIPSNSIPVQMVAAGGKLEGDALTMEVGPGTNIVTIVSRMDPSLKVAWPKVASQQAEVEAREFVFIKSNEKFRKIVSSGKSIDPKSIDGHLNFGDLPAYEVHDKQSLDLALKPIEKIGQESKAAVTTEAWIDFSGSEIFALQKIVFEKATQGWFEPSKSWTATQATNDGVPAIIAKGKDAAGRIATYTGLRELSVGLASQAGAIVEIPAIASDQVTATRSSIQLHLPLGWRALAVTGSGDSPTGWLASMNLWDWFLLIITAWAAKSLLGWRFAAGMVSTMVFGRLFMGAPFAIYLPTLALYALARHLPLGRLKSISFVGLIFMCLVIIGEVAPFTMSRLQKTLHTTLEDNVQPGAESSTRRAFNKYAEYNQSGGSPQMAESGESKEMDADAAPAPAALPAPVAMTPGSPAEEVAMRKSSVQNMAGSVLSDIGVRNMPKSMAAPKQNYVSVSGAQAGKGLPAWKSGITVPVIFSGPSTVETVAKIILLPSWGVKLVSLALLLSIWGTLIALIFGALKDRKAARSVQDLSNANAGTSNEK